MLVCCGVSTAAQTTITNTPLATNAPSKFRSAEDGWLDVSGFLDEKYGFLPVVIPITEPAVGYGAAGGLAFLEQAARRSPRRASTGPTSRSWAGWEPRTAPGAGRRATCAIGWTTVCRPWRPSLYASVNLDFHGVGGATRLLRPSAALQPRTQGRDVAGKIPARRFALLGGTELRLRHDARQLRRAGGHAGSAGLSARLGRRRPDAVPDL